MQNLKKPSKEFLEFLNVVNQLHGADLPIYASETKTIVFKAIEKHQPLYEYIFRKTINESLSLTEKRIGLWERYKPFREDRELLLRIVEEMSNIDFSAKDNIVIENAVIHVLVIINKKGLLDYEISSFKRFDGLDIRRFRSCVVCSDIFWLSRTDKKACAKCTNLAAQRKFQKENKREINKQRREKYYLQKGILYCDKCVHPTEKCNCYLNERRKK